MKNVERGTTLMMDIILFSIGDIGEYFRGNYAGKKTRTIAPEDPGWRETVNATRTVMRMMKSQFKYSHRVNGKFDMEDIHVDSKGNLNFRVAMKHNSTEGIRIDCVVVTEIVDDMTRIRKIILFNSKHNNYMYEKSSEMQFSIKLDAGRIKKEKVGVTVLTLESANDNFNTREAEDVINTYLTSVNYLVPLKGIRVIDSTETKVKRSLSTMFKHLEIQSENIDEIFESKEFYIDGSEASITFKTPEDADCTGYNYVVLYYYTSKGVEILASNFVDAIGPGEVKVDLRMVLHKVSEYDAAFRSRHDVTKHSKVLSVSSK